MREIMVRVGVLAAMSAVVPSALVGLAALDSPDDLEGALTAAIVSLILLAVAYGGWAARDGYHRWFGWWGPLLWFAIGATSPLGLALVATIVMGDIDDPSEALGTYAVVAGTAAGLSVISWLVGRAMPVGSFDVRDEPVRG